MLWPRPLVCAACYQIGAGRRVRLQPISLTGGSRRRKAPLPQLCVRTGTPPKFLISVRAFGVNRNRTKSSAGLVTVASR